MGQCETVYWVNPQLQCFCMKDEGHSGEHKFDLGEDGTFHRTQERVDNNAFWVSQVATLRAENSELKERVKKCQLKIFVEIGKRVGKEYLLEKAEAALVEKASPQARCSNESCQWEEACEDCPEDTG